jgi:4-hydroxythreonine-4-phosphate dehydrogenase
MGDAGGIGPEIIVAALSNARVKGIEPVVIGDPEIIARAAALRGVKTDFEIVAATKYEGGIEPKSSAESGHAAVACIRRAVSEAMAGNVDAIVTAPISKESLKLAGYSWPGHTELLAELTGTRDFAMMLAGGPLRVLLVTIHTALANVPGLITKDRVLSSIRLARRACVSLGLKNPRIGVAGLNPHAGEGGIFGDEEIREILPAVEAARAEGIPAIGPYPPDVIFRKAYRREFDIVVSMYHDQGLIPLKMIAFDRGVNVTVGLPIVRTSPDHGTAFDIAWRGMADCRSMIEAIRLAARLKLG